MGDVTTPRAAAVGRRGAGEARWWLGGLAEILLDADQTAGALSVIEVTEPAGASAPLHVHHREDETFVVQQGEATFEVGGASIAAAAGDVVFAPRGVPHSYVVGAAGCRMLFVVTPGGFEALVRELSVPAEGRTLPPPSSVVPDLEMIAAVAASHGCGLLC